MSKRNENRPGYKKTQVGWIPITWDSPTIDNYITLASGDTRPQSISEHQTLFHQVPVYGGNGILGYSNTENEYGKKIVIGRVGEKCGCVYLITGRYFITDNALYTKKFKKNISIEYLAYYLKYYDVSRLRNKGGQPLVSQRPIYNIRIPLPPLPEQKKIAEILSVWDHAIDQTRKLIDAKNSLKKGLKQQLLTGRMRSAAYKKSKDRIQTNYYSYPSDWKHPRISQIAKEVHDRNTDRKKYPVLSCSKYDGFVNSLEYFGKRVYSGDTSNYKIIHKWQFGFPSNHIEEGSIGLLKHVGIGIVSPIYVVFSVNPKLVFPQYLFALFKTETYTHIFSANTNSSIDRRGSLRWNEFSKIRVPLPSLKEQMRIAHTLSACDREIDLLTACVETLILEKKGLMQKLLTGNIRVKSES